MGSPDRSGRATSFVIFTALAMAIAWPVARFGEDGQLGRIDALSIHGMSHTRLDGLGDVPHVGLALLVLMSLFLGLFGTRAAADLAACAAVALAGLVAARLAARTAIVAVPDWGAWPLLVLFVVAAARLLRRPPLAAK